VTDEGAPVLRLSWRRYFKARSSGFWRRTVYQSFRGPCCLQWRWRQHGPLKCWYPATTLHGVTTQKISTSKVALLIGEMRIHVNKRGFFLSFHYFY